MRNGGRVRSAVAGTVAVAALAVLVAGCGLFRVSVGPDGVDGDGPSPTAAASAFGRFVAFTSTAANLVDGDTNGVSDVFVRDTWRHATERVSVTSAGAQADGASDTPSISADGRYVAFSSNAENLAAESPEVQAEGSHGVYVRDRVLGTTTRVDVVDRYPRVLGGESPLIDAAGTVVVFDDVAVDPAEPRPEQIIEKVFARDLRTGTTELVSHRLPGEVGLASATQPAVSADGRYVAYAFMTDDPGQPEPNPDAEPHFLAPVTSGHSVIHVFDRISGTTTMVPLPAPTSSGAIVSAVGPRLSGDGNLVAFMSWALATTADGRNDPMSVFVYDRTTGALDDLGRRAGISTPDHDTWLESMSPDGRTLAVWAPPLQSSDAALQAETYLVDRESGRASLARGAVFGFDPSSLFGVVTSSAGLLPDDGNGLDDVYVGPLHLLAAP